MILLNEQIVNYWKEFRNECLDMIKEGDLSRKVATEQLPMVDAAIKALLDIKAQQQEIEQLKHQERSGNCEQCGSLDYIDELRPKVEQLQAQNGAMTDILKELESLNGYLGKRCMFCGCYDHTLTCKFGIILDKLEEEKFGGKPTAYHNPADVAEIEQLKKEKESTLKQMNELLKEWETGKYMHNPADVEALAKVRKALCDLMYTLNFYMKESCIVPHETDKRHIRQYEEALEQIDKTGGGENEI